MAINCQNGAQIVFKSITPAISGHMAAMKAFVGAQKKSAVKKKKSYPIQKAELHLEAFGQKPLSH